MLFKKKSQTKEIQYAMYVVKDVISGSTAGDPFFNVNDIAVQRELLSFVKAELEKGNKIRLREMELYRIADIHTDMSVDGYEPIFVCSLSDMEENINKYLTTKGL